MTWQCTNLNLRHVIRLSNARTNFSLTKSCIVYKCLMLLFSILAIDRNLQRVKQNVAMKTTRAQCYIHFFSGMSTSFLINILSFYIITYFTSLFRTWEGALCRLTVTSCLNYPTMVPIIQEARFVGVAKLSI